jgi:RND family efflux transporter MFP subunit
MKRTLMIVAIVAVVGAVGFGVYTYMTGTSAASGSTLGGTGTIEAVNVTVSSQASGRIVAARLKVGDVVRKGQVLFMLDRQMSLQQIAQAEAGVKAAEATLQYAKDNSKTDAEIAQDSAAVDQAKATLKMAQIQYGYATVTAPISGVALTVPVNLGENATPGQTLARLGDTQHLTVSIYVPENQIGQVKIGKTGSLTTDSSDKTYKCVVTSVASQAEFTPASIETKDQRTKLVYQVKLDITDSDRNLKPGMPADVVLAQ